MKRFTQEEKDLLTKFEKELSEAIEARRIGWQEECQAILRQCHELQRKTLAREDES